MPKELRACHKIGQRLMNELVGAYCKLGCSYASGGGKLPQYIMNTIDQHKTSCR